MSRRGVVVLVSVVAVAVVIATGVAAYVLMTTIARSNGCTLGFYGSDWEITAEGAHAKVYCQSIIDTSAGGATGSAYALDQPDTSATLICRLTMPGWARTDDGRDLSGTIITVRDKGALKINGTDFCNGLAAYINQSASSP